MTTQLEQAARLALEALKQDRAWLESDAPKLVWDKNNEVITALRAALTDAALDKIAENERDLGIQMQPAQDEIDYKALFEQMCERCDVLDKQLAVYSEAQDEPVAWRWKERINGDFDNWVVTSSEPPPYAVEQQPLYTAPQPAQDEPVAWTTGFHNGYCVIRAADPAAILPIGIALYARPQPVPTSDTSQNRVDETAKQRHEQPVQVDWRDHVEQRLLTWRQSFVNRSGDQLALDDLMDKRSLDDLIDFVCDEYANPKQLTQDEPVAWPKTPSEISDMIGSSYVWREHKISDLEPHEDDKYCLTAHDLLEAIEHWREYTTPPQREPQPCPYVVSTREGTHHCSLSQREPLTGEMEDQAKRYISPHRRSAFRDGWRSAEQAHGIGEKK